MLECRADDCRGAIMTTLCAECGASFVSRISCRDYFDTAQAMEFEHPAYFVVHHLSVPCYLLQHNHYSAAGWFAARRLLHQFIFTGLTPQMARRQFQSHSPSNNSQTIQSSALGEKLVGAENINWSYTIGDVRSDTATNYCSDVREWAMAVLKNTAALL